MTLRKAWEDIAVNLLTVICVTGVQAPLRSLGLKSTTPSSSPDWTPWISQGALGKLTTLTISGE